MSQPNLLLACVSVCSYNQMRDNHLVCESAVAGEAAGIGMGLVMLGSADGPALTEMTNYARETQHEKIIRGLALGVALVMCVMYLRPLPSSLLPPTTITTASTATASYDCCPRHVCRLPLTAARTLASLLLLSHTLPLFTTSYVTSFHAALPSPLPPPPPSSSLAQQYRLFACLCRRDRRYGRQEQADGHIDALLGDKDHLLRMGATHMIATAYVQLFHLNAHTRAHAHAHAHAHTHTHHARSPYCILCRYVGTGENRIIKKLLHIAVSDVSDDVRRCAVTAMGFVLCRTPEQLPSTVSLLSESFNPNVRYGTCMALGIAFAGTGTSCSLTFGTHSPPLTLRPAIFCCHRIRSAPICRTFPCACRILGYLTVVVM
jgi:hypothetical protein